MCESDSRNARSARKLMPLVAVALNIALSKLCAQPNVQEVKGEAQRHFHSPDMSCCAPCASETNADPDVFKRPCFVRALSRSLEKPKRVCEGLTDAADVKLTQDRLPVHIIERFRGLLSTVLQPAFLPRRWDQVQLYVPYPVKMVTELRGDTRFLVGHEVNRAAEANDSKYDAMQTGWTVGAIDVLPRTSHPDKSPTGALIRLRLHGSERLDVRWRSKHPEVLSGSTEWEKWEFFDKVALHSFLTKVFRVPFGTPHDLVIDGYDTQYEGVAVFHGTILSGGRRHVWTSGDHAPQHWWDQMRLFVTDSDPQYFCVQITLREAD